MNAFPFWRNALILDVRNESLFNKEHQRNDCFKISHTFRLNGNKTKPNFIKYLHNLTNTNVFVFHQVVT